MTRPAVRTMVLVATMLAASWAVQAQDVDDAVFPEHVVTVEGAELAVVEGANTTRLTLGRSCANQEDAVTGEEYRLIQPSADGTSFTFDEQFSGARNPITGCQAAFYNVTLPGPARVLRLGFTVDRVVTNETAGTLVPCLPPACVVPPASMTQELTLDFPDGTRRIDPYFAPSAPSQPPTRIQREFLLPNGTSFVTLSWFFQDNGIAGPQADVDPGRARLASTVGDIRLELAGIVLETPEAEQGATEVINDTASTGQLRHYVNVTVPEGAVGDRRSASATLEIRRGPSSAGIFGPNGERVPDDVFNASRIGDRIRYVVGTETVATQGTGVYSYQFTTTRSLPPPAPPGDPTQIHAFYYVAVGLPLVAAILALYQASVFVHNAEGPYRRAARPVLVAVVLVVVYYALLVVYSFLVLGPDHMATLPLSREAILVYAQLVLLLVILAAAALAISRRLIRVMRNDLEERRLQQDQLKRSNEELERFAYVASHDLQEPLRKVAGFTALLQKRYAGQLDKDADEIIQYAVDGATRMQMLIKDILAYSRVGSRELHKVPVDSNGVMQLVMSDLGQTITDAGAKVKWGALPTVRADASQLRQVLQNLVENAIKYRRPDRKPVVEVSTVEEPNAWHFTVKDNGVGIPADKHEEIFGIFRRLHGDSQPGTGIGLAVVKKAIERHGGKVWVDSAVGKGSTFHFTLPKGALDRSSRRWSESPGDGLPTLATPG